MRGGFRPCSIANWGVEGEKKKIPETKPQMVLISVSQSLLTTDANIFKGYLFPKGSFLLIHKRKHILKFLERL